MKRSRLQPCPSQDCVPRGGRHSVPSRAGGSPFIPTLALLFLLGVARGQGAEVPGNLLLEGLEPAPEALRADVSRYLEFRTAASLSWHPLDRSMLIATRFADVPQLHWVDFPGGARRQITFSAEPIRGGSFRPRSGECIVFSQDTGGGEFFQLHRLNVKDGRATLLTDGKSRNTGARWSTSGKWIAYSSTLRNGRDTDLRVMDPDEPAKSRVVLEVSGGGWSVLDWSKDDRRWLVAERVSINESWLYLVDVATGTKTPLFAGRNKPASYGTAFFDPDGRHAYWTTDAGSEFLQLYRVDLTTRETRLLTGSIPWDIEEASLSPDGKRLAVVANEKGNGTLHLLDPKSGRASLRPALPAGVVSGIHWHENSRDLGFTLSSARSPSDAYSIDARSGAVSRWTDSEIGGLDATRFAEPERVELKSFDGLEISGFLYRPDPTRHAGRRPVLVNIHGGPESQSRPSFLGRLNYLVDELGVAVLLPNVRGSSGYGRTFLTLDNGMKREDSVRDIGAFLDWIRRDSGLDADRVAVMGGSYGGYMSLACMVHFSERLRCGVDVVGISSFLTFLKNTQDYRRDLRRVEYGDEREPGMAEFLQRISPLTQASRIRKPLFVVQGMNDPRVPVTEAEQMVKAIRAQGGEVGYLMARDEGHGFAKKKNADFQFLCTLQFLRKHLLSTP